MEKQEIDRKYYRCKRCSYTWLSHKSVAEIKVCAQCRSPYWNTDKKRKEGEDEKRKEGLR